MGRQQTSESFLDCKEAAGLHKRVAHLVYNSEISHGILYFIQKADIANVSMSI